MIWFWLDGIDSRTYGIYLQTPPDILSAEPDLEFIDIPGRDGSLLLDHGGYHDNETELQCYVQDVGNIGAAYGFMSGSHKFIFSTNPNRAYYGAFFGTAQSARMVRNLQAQEITAPVRFKPFRYFEPAPDRIQIYTSPGSINNPGSAESAPIITIVGSGNFTLTIGQYVLDFSDVDGGIIVDCDKNRLFNTDGITRALEHDIDEFPRLKPGINYVQWTGGIQSITIDPRWRDR